MTSAATTETPADEWEGIIEFSADEIAKLLDEEARRLLGMSGEEFERRFRAGEFWDQFERREVQRVTRYLPSDIITNP